MARGRPVGAETGGPPVPPLMRVPRLVRAVFAEEGGGGAAEFDRVLGGREELSEHVEGELAAAVGLDSRV